MKRLCRAILIWLIVISCFSCLSREINLDATLKHIREDFPSEQYEVSPSVASIFIDESLPGGIELKNIMDDLSSMAVIVIPFYKTAISEDSTKLFSIISKRINRQGLALLGEFRSEKEVLNVWAAKSNVISDLVVVNQSNNYLYVVHFKGNDIAERKIQALIHPENRPILEYLYRLKAQ